MKIRIRDIDTGIWEVVDIATYHDYKKHPLITFVREYETVTMQQAFDDALKDINEIIAQATKERDALLNKEKPVTIINDADHSVTEVEKT